MAACLLPPSEQQIVCECEPVHCVSDMPEQIRCNRDNVLRKWPEKQKHLEAPNTMNRRTIFNRHSASAQMVNRC